MRSRLFIVGQKRRIYDEKSTAKYMMISVVELLVFVTVEQGYMMRKVLQKSTASGMKLFRLLPWFHG